MNSNYILCILFVTTSFGIGIVIGLYFNGYQNNIVLYGMAEIGNPTPSSIIKIISPVILAKQQDNMTSVYLQNMMNLTLNDPEHLIKNQTMISISLLVSSPNCIPILSYDNHTLISDISVITNKTLFKHYVFSQACETHSNIETFQSWDIIK